MYLIFAGVSNINADRTLKAAEECRIAGIQMVIVPLGRNFNNIAEINGMASDPIEFNVIPVENIDSLPDIVDNVVMASCERELEIFWFKQIFIFLI